jgi:prevent-host-death family protein
MRTMPAGLFKAKCLAVLDEVQKTGEPVLITKRGKPVAQLVSPDQTASGESPSAIFDSLRGMILMTGDLGNLVDPIVSAEEWDHLKDDWSLFPKE